MSSTISMTTGRFFAQLSDEEPSPRTHAEALPDTLRVAADRIAENLARRQKADGSWRGDYGGPNFLTPIYVIVRWRMGGGWNHDERRDLERHLRATQNDDGSWGLHDEGEGQLFPTVPTYIALRLLGVEADDTALRKARAWMRPRGGALHQASWGRVFCALAGVYPWEAVDPLIPELWIAPYALPVHPGRMWCHARMVYLPMAWLYGRQSAPPESPLISSLREELYNRPWSEINWSEACAHVAVTDAHKPRTSAMKLANRLLLQIDRRSPRALRQLAMRRILKRIRAEDENTDAICIGPINKMLHALIWHEVAPSSQLAKRHRQRMRDYLWETNAGVHIQGYESSQLWDTAFALQSLSAARHANLLDDRIAPVARRAASFVEAQQVRHEVPYPRLTHRGPSVGGWPFSTLEHGWPITDCTAEGLKAGLAAEAFGVPALEEKRLREAVVWMLRQQNPDGGWPTYERQRAGAWLELFNPSDVFDDIMIDYSYVECTSACVQALVAVRERLSLPLRLRVDRALRRAERYIRKAQREDGSWQGSWGVCFSYGTWFGVAGLRSLGASTRDAALQEAAGYLLAKEHPDGAWGEDFRSCPEGRWIQAEAPRVVTTSWALMTLCMSGHAHHGCVERGVRLICERVGNTGEAPPEGTAGVFNRSCGIHYDNYRRYFPLWALAEVSEAWRSVDVPR